MEPAQLVGLLAEPERLRVVAALVLGARGPAEISVATGLDAKVVAAALRRLHTGGLIEETPGGYLLRAALFKEVARAAAPPLEDKPHGYADPKVEQLVRTFVRDGRLIRLPSRRERRRVVLEHVAASFEPGVRYPEREVDAVLRAWTSGGLVDHVTVRRYLVDEGLLDRDGGEYWRCGGWLDATP